MRMCGRLREPEPMVNPKGEPKMTQPDRRSRGGIRTLFQQNPGRRAEDVHAMRAWHPAARVAVVTMVGILGGINIWMDTVLEVNSLPTLRVAVSSSQAWLSLASSLHSLKHRTGGYSPSPAFASGTGRELLEARALPPQGAGSSRHQRSDSFAARHCCQRQASRHMASASRWARQPSSFAASDGSA